MQYEYGNIRAEFKLNEKFTKNCPNQIHVKFECSLHNTVFILDNRWILSFSEKNPPKALLSLGRHYLSFSLARGTFTKKIAREAMLANYPPLELPWSSFVKDNFSMRKDVILFQPELKVIKILKWRRTIYVMLYFSVVFTWLWPHPISSKESIVSKTRNQK